MLKEGRDQDSTRGIYLHIGYERSTGFQNSGHKEGPRILEQSTIEPVCSSEQALIVIGTIPTDLFCSWMLGETIDWTNELIDL